MNWEDLVYVTAERFGGNMPHPDTAAAIAQVHERAPKAVEAAINRIAAEYEDGTVRSPWGLLKSRVQQIQTDIPKAEKRNDQQRDIERAEQWIRAAGLYMTWSEVQSELFDVEEVTAPLDYLTDLELSTRGSDGRAIFGPLLRASIVRTTQEGQQIIEGSGGILQHHDSPELRDKMLELWNTERPRGIAAEQEADDRAARYRDQMARVSAQEARTGADSERTGKDQSTAELIAVTAPGEPDDDSDIPW
jgi:hypothetical protein